jgi:phage-related baseplate assembly protein
MTIAQTPAEVEAAVLASYTLLTGKTLQASDPRRLLLQSLTTPIAHLYSLIELADLRNLPATADGASLDNLGTFVGTTRLVGQGSVVTLSYSRTNTAAAQIIPAGHRVTTADGLYLWATTAALTLGIGVASGSVTARCTVTGPESNDIVAGQINVLVDPIAGLAVASTTDTAGGTDVQTDDEFRVAVVAAPDGFTIAGPRSAYEWHAKQASTLVLDAIALGPDDTDTEAPAAGGVAIFLLIGAWAEGVLELETDPTVIADVIDLVEAALSADTVRPIGDLVTVDAAAEIPFTCEVSYWIPQAEAANVAAIQAAVEAAQDAYLDWQEAALGRDVDPTELVSLLYAAGARRIVVTSPTYQAIQQSERAARDSYVAAPTYLGLFR